ncbi:uncharacterized protein LOC135811608 [Sycon ciliatum]|uniref:uncharacterized protein LOC135811608 n=1 Tax=Sycon ciliatum TaxID=27933 RepID=UPI0031F698D4
MVHLSVCFQTKYSLIVLVTTLVAITTEIWCLTPRCIPEAHRLYRYEGTSGGLNTFKWYNSHISGTLSYRYLVYNRVYSTTFEFQGSCTIEAIAISFKAHGNCRVSVSSQSFDHSGWSNERSVRFSHRSKHGFRHNLNFTVQSSHGLQIKFTVHSAITRPLSQCVFQLNEAYEPVIALHVQEDYDECSALHNPCYRYYPIPDSGPHCHNTWGSYRCNCQHGYKRTQDGNTYTCNDIDECAQSDNHCYTHFRRDNAPNCINTPGTYDCVCRQGYDVEGVTNETLLQCRDIDECSLTPHHCSAYSAQGPGKCVNIPGSYVCNCFEGFTIRDTLNGRICVASSPTQSPTTSLQHTGTAPATTSSETREKFPSYPSLPPTEYASHRTTHLRTSSAPHNVTSPIAIPATTQSDTMMPGSNTSSSSVTILVSLLVIGLMLMTLLLAVGLWKRRQIAKFFHRNEITARPATTSEGQVAVSARFRADREEMQLSHQPSNPVTNEYTVAVVGVPREYATVPERDGHRGEQMYSEATAPSNILIVRSGHRIPPDTTDASIFGAATSRVGENPDAERYTQPVIQRSVVNSSNLQSQYTYIESSSRVLSATCPRVHGTPGPAPPSLPNDTYSVPHSQPVSNHPSSRRVTTPSDYLEPSDC